MAPRWLPAYAVKTQSGADRPSKRARPVTSRNFAPTLRSFAAPSRPRARGAGGDRALPS